MKGEEKERHINKLNTQRKTKRGGEPFKIK